MHVTKQYTLAGKRMVEQNRNRKWRRCWHPVELPVGPNDLKVHHPEDNQAFYSKGHGETFEVQRIAGLKCLSQNKTNCYNKNNKTQSNRKSPPGFYQHLRAIDSYSGFLDPFFHELQVLGFGYLWDVNA